MKIIKRNQLTILVLSLMLVTAGYLNYTSNTETASTQLASIGDATLVSSNLSNSIENNIEENVTLNNETVLETEASSVSTEEENVVTTNTQTEAKDSSEEYFTSSKLERDTMYSQMLESYQKILDSKTTTDKQKEAAQVEIDKINKNKNAIMISENLIKTKGFENVVIFINDNSISVIIKKLELNKEDIAQIQSIIAREMNASIENIHIMNEE